MNEDQNIETQIWNYMDGTISVEEKALIEGLLLNNAKWQKVYSEILQLQILMKNDIELDEPYMSFTKNIMEEIAALQITPATKTYINKRIINGIAAFFMILIGGLLIYGFTQVDWTANGNVLSSFNLPKLDQTKYFTSQFMNTFLMINVVLGLILLDRFLAKNMNRQKQQHT
ncbi:MAG: hypothetical protein ABI760_07740 [Ferruginibacter sp.]